MQKYCVTAIKYSSYLAVMFVFHTPLTYFMLVMGPPAGPLPDSVRRECRQSRRQCGWVVELGICDWHQHKSPFISRSYAKLHRQTESQARAQTRQEILFCDQSEQGWSPCPLDFLFIYLFAQQIMHKQVRGRDYVL